MQHKHTRRRASRLVEPSMTQEVLMDDIEDFDYDFDADFEDEEAEESPFDSSETDSPGGDRDWM